MESRMQVKYLISKLIEVYTESIILNGDPGVLPISTRFDGDIGFFFRISVFDRVGNQIIDHTVKISLYRIYLEIIGYLINYFNGICIMPLRTHYSPNIVLNCYLKVY